MKNSSESLEQDEKSVESNTKEGRQIKCFSLPLSLNVQLLDN
jgi:hypothetical protein